MNQSKRIHMMVLSALLIAIGILIPMFSPVKIMIEPMSFTLASHVAIMIAVFVSPGVGVSVAMGTTLGFLMAGFPLPVVLRALSHVVWAFGGAYYLKKHPETLTSIWKMSSFMLIIGIVHAILEILVVIPFYLGNEANTFMYMVFGLVGIGTIIHSSVDFIISVFVWKTISKNVSVSSISNVKHVSFRRKKLEVEA